MRRNIVFKGASELSYEIREIVSVAHQFKDLGVDICWENIGDPIQKGTLIPKWMTSIISDLAQDSASYSYSPTKGILSTREFLAKKVNSKGGVQITAEDILFCNGLGDAISKLYRYLDPSARIIGPSPAYSTHSSAEGSHASQPPVTYKLDPENQWLPDMQDLYHKIKQNPNIVGILIINPDNPTGIVYPPEVLKQFVAFAKEFNLFLLADEVYTHITYNGKKALQLCEVVGDVPAISMKGISKEFPWPGSRCGWLEFYNTDKEAEFLYLVNTLENAKMMEVCSTTLPQLAIPKVMSHPNYLSHRQQLNDEIEVRANVVYETLKEVKELIVNKTYGAFYTTIVFKEGYLTNHQSLKIEDNKRRELVEKLVQSTAMDKRFVYYLLAKTGICVVPISSFCSELLGFRVTLLETNEEKLQWLYTTLKETIKEYLAS